MDKETEGWVHTLYIMYANDLYRTAKYRLQDPELAYDLTQEVFLTLLGKVEQVKDHPNPGGWLFQTLRYKIGHEFEKQNSRAARETGEIDLDGFPAPPAEGENLDEILPKEISPRDRQLLKLAYEEGLTYQEMSRRLGVPPATCGTWLHRAKKRCKQYFLKAKGGEPHGTL